MVKISNNDNNPDKFNNSGKLSDAQYDQQQKNLARKIKPQAGSLNDLKHAREIKKQQIALAQKQGDTEGVKNLQSDLAMIEADIRKNTSIFS